LWTIRTSSSVAVNDARPVLLFGFRELFSAPSRPAVYERVPHITLKSIANNAEIDVIWHQWQAKLEPLREKLNAALKRQWQEWEIPRDPDKAWPDSAKALHADWSQARIGRQKEIDASIAAKTEFEYLYDKPYEDRRKVRVAGPYCAAAKTAPTSANVPTIVRKQLTAADITKARLNFRSMISFQQ
jgi:hypothetical protein